MTLISVKHVSNSARVRFGNWRIDDDGFLRVTAHVLKEGVYAYSAEETFGDKTFGDILPETDTVQQYIPAAEFTEDALASLEGKPVTAPLKAPGEDWHQWRNPENALKDFLTVGVIAGRPTVTDDGCIACDMLIMDPDAMRGMKVDGWNQDAFDGAFEMLAANAKNHVAKKKEPARVLNGKKVIRDEDAHRRGNAIPRNNFERLQAAIKAKNSRPEEIQQANILTRLLNALEGRK